MSKNRKRLAVELDAQLDTQMRKAARKSWMTVTTFVHRAIAEKIVRDFGHTALHEVVNNG